MIIVAFKPLDWRKQANFPPLIVKLNEQTMNNTVSVFKKRVHQHFKPYLSPFITEQNLKLSIKQSPSMINDLPLYMYISLKEYSIHVVCTTKPNVADQEEQKWKFIKNSLIYKVEAEDSICSIPQKEVKMIDYVFEKISLKHSDFQVIINSTVVERIGDLSWSRMLADYWKDFSRENECIYVKICTQRKKNVM